MQDLKTALAHNPTISPPERLQPAFRQRITSAPALRGLRGVNTKEALDLAACYGYNIRQWVTSPDGKQLPAQAVDQPRLAGRVGPGHAHHQGVPRRARKSDNPNGNGLADEIPIAGVKALHTTATIIL